MSAKKNELRDKAREIQLRLLRARQGELKRGNDYVPSKSRVKYSGKVSVPQAERNLRGVPGSSRPYASMLQEIAAKGTGTRVVAAPPGLLRSARNANTTQGNYVTTVVRDEVGNTVSDAQGRKVFGE